MIRRPPRSTPFPTRRSSDLGTPARAVDGSTIRCRTADSLSPPARSEEHTSELQSQSNLVCRLLLEKKKKKKHNKSDKKINKNKKINLTLCKIIEYDHSAIYC